MNRKGIYLLSFKLKSALTLTIKSNSIAIKDEVSKRNSMYCVFF